MTIDEILLLLKATQPNGLTPLQENILRSSWDGKTYTSIATDAHYGEERVRKVASALWHLLSEFWQEPVNKVNFRTILEHRKLTRIHQQLIKEFNRTKTAISLEFPSGPVSLESRLYVARPPIEERVYAEIAEPGSFICIKAPKRMGKSSLILRILAEAENLSYRTVALDFQQADKIVFASLDKFLRWFCANVSRELRLMAQLNDYWDEDMGSKISCTTYFQSYLLPSAPNPLVLVLNEIDWIFEYPEIAGEFLALLRSWHEQTRRVKVWRQIRLVLSYSTEILVSSGLTQSAFNVGLPLVLPCFTKEQVQDLAQRHGLDWSGGDEVESLMKMLGGHPYLTRLTFYHLMSKGGLEGNLSNLLRKAPYEGSIYDEYLKQYVIALRQESELAAAFYEVINSNIPVKLEPILAYRLQNMGLISLSGDRATVLNELYRLYFREHLGGKRLSGNDSRVEELERENEQLRVLSTLDELTQLGNRRYFNSYLQIEWQRCQREGRALSLILCDIDYLKYYNKSYGSNAGDDCLRQIANVIRKCVKRPLSYSSLSNSGNNIHGKSQNSEQNPVFLARYGGEEFAILVVADATAAVLIAENIRDRVKDLAIPCEYPGIGGLPASVLTVSLGVTTIIPQADIEAESLVITAEKALHQAKRKGRDRVIILG
jgi:GGDEF domain-containing protein